MSNEYKRHVENVSGSFETPSTTWKSRKIPIKTTCSESLVLPTDVCHIGVEQGYHQISVHMKHLGAERLLKKERKITAHFLQDRPHALDN